MIGFVHFNQTTNTFSVLRALITTIFIFDSLVIKPFRIDLGHIFKISWYIGTNLVLFLNENKCASIKLKVQEEDQNVIFFLTNTKLLNM